MAASGYTPLQLYHSTTPGAEPSAGDLATGELAINVADGNLFYKNVSGVVENLAGLSGYSGISGYSGFSGADGGGGTSGSSGYSGFSGISGFSGFSGISGFSGRSGFSGTSGYSGAGFSFTNYTITQVGTKLIFSYNATPVASLDSTGNFTVLQNVTAFGSP